jgi:hypothetical protein
MCQLVNPSHAERCDCGYDFVSRGGGGRQASPRICQGCGVEAETKNVAFRQNIGAVFVRFPSMVEGRFCKSCVNKYFLKMTATTFFVGWWGMISMVVTPFILINNIGTYLSCLGMTPVPEGAIANKRVISDKYHRDEVPRPAQLVGQNCSICGERIPDEIDSEFCRGCKSPIHNRCINPSAGTGCSICGASVPTGSKLG